MIKFLDDKGKRTRSKSMKRLERAVGFRFLLGVMVFASVCTIGLGYAFDSNNLYRVGIPLLIVSVAGYIWQYIRVARYAIVAIFEEAQERLIHGGRLLIAARNDAGFAQKLISEQESVAKLNDALQESQEFFPDEFLQLAFLLHGVITRTESMLAGERQVALNTLDEEQIHYLLEMVAAAQPPAFATGGEEITEEEAMEEYPLVDENVN